MNERIRQLAEQAGFQYIKEEGIGWAGNHNASLPKFAELIVRECGEIAYIKYWENPKGVRGIHIKDAILENFGVE